jgi:coenzyme PQQ precursor peptide PqqA
VSATRPKPPSSTNGFGKQTEFANRDRRDACVDPSLSVARLAQERSGFAQEGNSGVRCVGMTSTSDVPRLRYVRGQPSFDAGTNVVPTLLGRSLMSWKTPKIVEVPVGMEINMYACAARK